jgi:putative oxidoreductase
MRIASIIARYLLGLMFTVFGLNAFFHFIPQPPPPPGLVTDYMHVMMASHYIYFIAAFEVLAGVLLLIDRFVPLALTILAAIIANVFIFHLTMAPATIGPGILAAILWILVFIPHRHGFRHMFRGKPE